MRRLRVCGGVVACCGIAVLMTGCLERELAPLSPCLISTVSTAIDVNNVDSVDVLFMVDNSNSMRQEQAALARELPQLVRVLSSGDRDGDGVQDFRPVSLRLGVVSSDLGLPGVQGDFCPSGLGDNAVLQHESNLGNDPALNCQGSYPQQFLSFSPPQPGVDAAAEVERVANDFACISSLGTAGCGIEQQLESALKALWPSDNRVQGQDVVSALGQFPFFLADPFTQQGGTGNGAPLGPNAGFLRSDPAAGVSLIAVVLVTDEEDCSSWTMEHLLPQGVYPSEDPRRLQPGNLRCFHNKQNLFPVQRYINGLKALRPGSEDMVVFAAITGVEPTLVSEDILSRVDFSNRTQSDAFYDRILAHDSMRETINAEGDNLNTSCTTTVGGVLQEAYPPRRIVEVAKGFGANGIVQSICQGSFAPAMNRIIETIVGKLPSVCLPRKLVRDMEGKVDCRVVWELPLASIVAPTVCEDPRYTGVLARPPSGRKTHTDDNRAICEVTQLPVGPCTPTGATEDTCQNGKGPLAGVDGWFYDDFSSDALACSDTDKQRISFSAAARPPTGVVVRLECTSEVQSISLTRDDLLNPASAPRLADECEEDAECVAALRDPAACASGAPFREARDGTCFDTSMFCHASNRRCVQACISDADCPPAWQCDIHGAVQPLAETNGHPICVNPTCGD